MSRPTYRRAQSSLLRCHARQSSLLYHRVQSVLLLYCRVQSSLLYHRGTKSSPFCYYTTESSPVCYITEAPSPVQSTEPRSVSLFQVLHEDALQTVQLPKGRHCRGRPKGSTKCLNTKFKAIRQKKRNCVETINESICYMCMSDEPSKRLMKQKTIIDWTECAKKLQPVVSQRLCGQQGLGCG